MSLSRMVNGELQIISAEEEAKTLADWSAEDALRAKNDAENGYLIKRRFDYPNIADQLDMLWHSMDSGEIPESKEFYSALKLVKDKYPKPT